MTEKDRSETNGEKEVGENNKKLDEILAAIEKLDRAINNVGHTLTKIGIKEKTRNRISEAKGKLIDTMDRMIAKADAILKKTKKWRRRNESN